LYCRYRRFLEEKNAETGLEFKTHLSKPLNHLSSCEYLLRTIANATDPNSPDIKQMLKCVSIVEEANRYIRSAVDHGDNHARVKEIEVSLQMSKKQDTDLLYCSLLHRSIFKHREVVQVLNAKASLKKKETGVLIIFDNMLIVAVELKQNQYRLKRAYRMDTLRVEEFEGNVLQFVATVQSDAHQNTTDILDTKCRVCCPSPEVLRELVEMIKSLTFKNRIFGESLSTLIEREQSSIAVPLVIQQAANYLLAHGTYKSRVVLTVWIQTHSLALAHSLYISCE